MRRDNVQWPPAGASEKARGLDLFIQSELGLTLFILESPGASTLGSPTAQEESPTQKMMIRPRSEGGGKTSLLPLGPHTYFGFVPFSILFSWGVHIRFRHFGLLLLLLLLDDVVAQYSQQAPPPPPPIFAAASWIERSRLGLTVKSPFIRTSSVSQGIECTKL